jgi:hypothetical protein
MPAATTAGMNRKPLFLLGLCLLSMAAPAAHADDASYCAELSNLYRRYLGQSSNRGPIPDAAASNAMSDCQKGNTAAGIPVLEKRLTDARFTLPKRN